MQKGHKAQTKTHSTIMRQRSTEEGSGEIQWKAPTPEGEDAIKRRKGSRALVKPEGAPTPEPEVRDVPSMEENKV